MAGASLLTLLDDIATLLDDVSILTKVAAKKTAGVIGDDLALNAQQVAGVKAARELPVAFTSLRRPTGATVFAGSPGLSAEIVPSAAIVISAPSGTAIGPASPITGCP